MLPPGDFGNSIGWFLESKQKRPNQLRFHRPVGSSLASELKMPICKEGWAAISSFAIRSESSRGEELPKLFEFSASLFGAGPRFPEVSEGLHILFFAAVSLSQHSDELGNFKCGNFVRG